LWVIMGFGAGGPSRRLGFSDFNVCTPGLGGGGFSAAISPFAELGTDVSMLFSVVPQNRIRHRSAATLFVSSCGIHGGERNVFLLCFWATQVPWREVQRGTNAG
jgi:hypothetical protein